MNDYPIYLPKNRGHICTICTTAAFLKKAAVVRISITAQKIPGNTPSQSQLP
jgi:hypothetical protein